MPAHATKAEQPPAPADRAAAPQSHAAAEFTDRRPAAAAQQQQQALINQSPRLQRAAANQALIAQSPRMQQTAQRQAATTPGQATSTPLQEAPAPAQENRTGLPDELKAGVESLSGYSLDDVRVHHNSAEPAQLQAHAYAQGTDIHVGPGQEKHLPHEAWHVVQQKQGRVQATRQLKAGVPGNDDAGLEQEADRMGARAAQLVVPAGPATFRAVGAGPALVQCKPYPYETSAPQEQKDAYRGRIAAIVADINGKVIQARAEALQWRVYENSSNPHLRNWFLVADQYRQEPEESIKIIYARFGYAIETLVNGQVGDMQGLRISLQHSVGHTRPDIVVFDGREEIAWIDITSENSYDHIQGKSGAGWKTRPFVYEIRYDSLDLKDILSATNDEFYNEYGRFVADEKNIELSTTEVKRSEFRQQFIGLQEKHGWQTGFGNAKEKQTATKDFFFGEAVEEREESEDYRNKMQATRGALDYAGLNDGSFGFNTGNVGKRTELAKSIVKSRAEPDIKLRKDTLTRGKNAALLGFLRPYRSIPVVAQFEEVAEMFPLDREVAKTGIMLKQAVVDLGPLNAQLLFVRSHMPESDHRARELELALKEQLKVAIAEPEFELVQRWRQETQRWLAYAPVLQATLVTQRKFITYTQQEFNFFNQPIEVTRLLGLLNEKPVDNRHVAAAEHWMKESLNRHAEHDMAELTAILDYVRTHLSGFDERVRSFEQDLERHMSLNIQAADFNRLHAWRQELGSYQQYARLLRSTLAAQRDFQGYVQRRYPNFFTRPAEVTQLLFQLSTKPVDNRYEVAAQDWVRTHPIGPPAAGTDADGPAPMNTTK